jgi:L-lactate permease
MNLTSFLKSWLPEESQKAKDMAGWEEQVKKALKEESMKVKWFRTFSFSSIMLISFEFTPTIPFCKVIAEETTFDAS